MFAAMKEAQHDINFVFNEKCVFITGATGFLGKVLLEKLLRSCPSISKVLVLMRPTEECTTANERLQRLFESSVFDRVKSECPTHLNKVYAISGDVTETDLELDEVDKNVILTEVNFVFHCAASVRFEGDARRTLMINFIGVKNVMELCREMKSLTAVIHVSTAYSFCNRQVIGEKIYDEECDLSTLAEITRHFDDESLERVSKSLSESRPSLYQYSKAMSEIYIATTCKALPVIIVRPSIITAAAREPYSGWIDNYNGPSGFIALSSKGIIKTLQVKQTVNADWVPVDHVANTLIVAAYHKAMITHFPNAFLLPLFSKSGVPIVNCVCPHTNAITWSKVVQICVPLLHQYPSLDSYGVPGGVVTSSKMLHVLCRGFCHYIPAAMLDVGWLLLRRETRCVKYYVSIHKVLDYLQHYTMNDFQFKCSNMNILIESVQKTDLKTFPIDQNSLNWEQYLEDYVHGVRLFFLKEDDNTLPKARERIKRLKLYSLLMKATPVAIALFFAVKRRDEVFSYLPFAVQRAFRRVCSRLVFDF